MKYAAEPMTSARTDRAHDPRWLVREDTPAGRTIAVTIGGDDRAKAEQIARALDRDERLAHELGNAAFAIETNLESLRRRVERGDRLEAVVILNEITVSLERIKAFVKDEPAMAPNTDERLRALKLRRKKK